MWLLGGEIIRDVNEEPILLTNRKQKVITSLTSLEAAEAITIGEHRQKGSASVCGLD
jgi:hypothetical protein